MDFRQQEEYSYYKKLCEFRGAQLLDIHNFAWKDHWEILKLEEIRNSKSNKPVVELFRDEVNPERIKLETYFDVILFNLDYILPKVIELNDPELDIDLLRHGISVILDFKYKIGSGG